MFFSNRFNMFFIFRLIRFFIFWLVTFYWFNTFLSTVIILTSFKRFLLFLKIMATFLLLHLIYRITIIILFIIFIWNFSRFEIVNDLLMWNSIKLQIIFLILNTWICRFKRNSMTKLYFTQTENYLFWFALSLLSLG